MSRRPSDVDPFAGPAPAPYARATTADRAREAAPASAPPGATLSGASQAVREAGAEASSMRKVDQDLEFLIRARSSVLYMLTGEEKRAEATISRVAKRRQTKVFIWSITEGMRLPDETSADWNPADYKDPLKALQFVLDRDVRGIFVMRDAHPFQKNPEFVRKMRDVAHKLKTTKKTLILMSSVLAIPPEMEKELAVIEFPLPDLGEITEIFEKNLSNALEAYADNPDKIERINASVRNTKDRERIIEGALGLTAEEVENVFAKTLVQENRFDIKIILSEKERIVKKSGILEFFPTQEKMENIGGLDRLKEWLGKREAAFGKDARAYGLPRPKGILMLGIPGCGKSLTAKAVGAFWQMPLLRLDMGKVFAGLVGGSEENMRRAIGMAEAVSPSILWLVELEKGLSGTQSSGSTDGGTSARVFGSFIAWMQEKTSPVFVMATANDVSQLPPELMRKGRFDEIFFVDLPTVPEREEIFKIHVRKRSNKDHVRDLSDEEMKRLAEVSDGFSGAEIEQAVVSAMFDAFYKGDEVTATHIEQALNETVPLSRTMKEKIAELRQWCRTRARPASSAYEQKTASDAPRSLDL
jgi:ATP-dependent 26S proteasome regulatory subunit